MCQWSCIENWSLKKQLIFMFSVFEAGLLLVVILIASISVGVITTNYSSSTKSALLDQSTSQMAAIIGDGCRLLDFKLTQLTEWMTIVATTNQDLTRSDYCYGLNGTSYMDYSAATLAPPVTYLPQYNGGLSALSFSHSSYHVPNKGPADIPTFTSGVTNDISKSTITDPTVKRCFVAGGDFFSIYSGFAGTGVNREYPGVATPSFATVIAYDPRNEDWYQAATNRPKRAGSTTRLVPAYSFAYYDTYVQRFMITISLQFNSLTNTAVAYGASGGDVTLTQLQTAVANIKYLTATSLLFERSTGALIASSGATVDKTGLSAVAIPTYANVRKPSISSAIWTEILGNAPLSGQEPGLLELQGGALTDGSYFFVIQSLATGDVDTAGTTGESATYVLVCTISRNDALAPSASVTSDIDSYIQQYIIITCVVFVVVLIMVLSITGYFTNRFVAPLVRLAKHVDQISSVIGTPNAISVPAEEGPAAAAAAAGGGDAKDGGLVDEETALSNAYRQVVLQYNAGRKEAAEIALPPNPYFGKPLPFYSNQSGAAVAVMGAGGIQIQAQASQFAPKLSVIHPNSRRPSNPAVPAAQPIGGIPSLPPPQPYLVPVVSSVDIKRDRQSFGGGLPPGMIIQPGSFAAGGGAVEMQPLQFVLQPGIIPVTPQPVPGQPDPPAIQRPPSFDAAEARPPPSYEESKL